MPLVNLQLFHCTYQLKEMNLYGFNFVFILMLISVNLRQNSAKQTNLTRSENQKAIIFNY